MRMNRRERRARLWPSKLRSGRAIEIISLKCNAMKGSTQPYMMWALLEEWRRNRKDKDRGPRLRAFRRSLKRQWRGR